MQPTSNPGPLVQLAHTIENLPGFIGGWVVSTLTSILSDPLVFCLTLGAIAFGFVYGVVAACAMFFLIYPTLRMVATVAQAVHAHGGAVSQAVIHHANVQLQTQQGNPQTITAPEHNE